MIKIYVNDKDFKEIAAINCCDPGEFIDIPIWNIRILPNDIVRIRLPGDFIVSAEYEEMEKSKMTRAECIKNIGATHEAELLVDRLHALGLLKFEEPSPRPEKGVKFKGANDVIYTVHDEMIDAKPIQKGKFTLIQMENGSFIQGNISHIEQP